MFHILDGGGESECFVEFEKNVDVIRDGVDGDDEAAGVGQDSDGVGMEVGADVGREEGRRSFVE